MGLEVVSDGSSSCNSVLGGRTTEGFPSLLVIGDRKNPLKNFNSIHEKNPYYDNVRIVWCHIIFVFKIYVILWFFKDTECYNTR